MVDAARLINKTGRLPMPSDNLPQIGVKKNCIIEYDESNQAIAMGVAPSSSATVGRTGIIIPKPIKSIKTTKNISTRGSFEGFFWVSSVVDVITLFLPSTDDGEGAGWLDWNFLVKRQLID